jgi:hypothetical protein|tara:strand:+ start:1115 stop:1363 length:249 start_codon:yes stop_codon:yes gene_type:complete
MSAEESPNLAWVTTPGIIEELQSRHPNLVVCYEKDPSGDDQSTLVIAGPEPTAAGLAKALGLCEAVKTQLQLDLYILGRAGA